MNTILVNHIPIHILLLLLLVISRYTFTCIFRQTNGIIIAIGKNIPIHPCNSQICRRINKMDIMNNRVGTEEDEGIVIGIDSTDIKITIGGQ